MLRQNNKTRKAELTIAGYWPLVNELDIRPIFTHLFERSFNICLPVIVKKDLPLVFKTWSPGDKLVKCGSFNIFEPAEDK